MTSSLSWNLVFLVFASAACLVLGSPLPSSGRDSAPVLFRRTRHSDRPLHDASRHKPRALHIYKSHSSRRSGEVLHKETTTEATTEATTEVAAIANIVTEAAVLTNGATEVGEVGAALRERHMTRVIFDEEGVLTERRFYEEERTGEDGRGEERREDMREESYEEDDDSRNPSNGRPSLSKGHKQGVHSSSVAEKSDGEYPKKFLRAQEDPQARFPKEGTEWGEESPAALPRPTLSQDSHEEATPVPGIGLPEGATGSRGFPGKKKKKKGKGAPVVLPVTTEGRSSGRQQQQQQQQQQQKTEDPLKVYGIPKELLPIMPGGGSRFEDVEREKLERKKMSQTKGGDDDSAENGGSHEAAEGLYSSASLSSFSLCFYWLLSFHHLDRILPL